MLPSLIRIEIKKVTNLDCKCKMIQEQNHRLRASYGQSLKAYTTRVGVKTKNYCVNLRRKKNLLVDLFCVPTYYRTKSLTIRTIFYR